MCRVARVRRRKSPPWVLPTRMAKHKPKPSAATAGSGRPWQCWASVVVMMAAVVALGLAALQPSDPVPSPASPPASARQDGRRSAATVDLGPGELAGFSAEHNASLMWGTYRPGVYFGLRSRTYPTALVAGLMWGALDGVASERKLRHTCEQDEVQRYGYTEHDGEAYASQPIVDRENGLELQTSFVKPDTPEAAGAWAARIEGKLLPGQSKGAPQTVIFYLGIDGDGGGASRLSVAGERPTFTPGAGTHVTGEVDGVGRFSLLAEGRSNAGGARSDDDAEVCEAERGPSLQPRCWGGAGAQATYLHVREIAGRELLDSAELRLSDEVSEDSQLLLVQFVATPPFTLDFVYVPGSARLTHPPPPTPRPLTHITSARRARSPYRARRAHRPRSPYRPRRFRLPAAPPHLSSAAARYPGGCEGEACRAAYSALSGRQLSALLERRHAAYEAGVARAFALDTARLGGAPLSDATRRFAGAILGAQLGSLGYFYGTTSVAGPDGREIGAAAPPQPERRVRLRSGHGSWRARPPPG